METTWKTVWRDGIAPLLSSESLVSLRQALAEDDPRLVQGKTVVPQPSEPRQPCRAACALAWCGWLPESRPLRTVMDVQERFDALCILAIPHCGGAPGLAQFFEWFDETPRADMRAELLAEVDLALSTRAPTAAEGAPVEVATS